METKPENFEARPITKHTHKIGGKFRPVHCGECGKKSIPQWEEMSAQWGYSRWAECSECGHSTDLGE